MGEGVRLPEVRENLRNIRENIRLACRRAARSEDQVRVMAVTKKQTPERILEAAACGLDLFGENRVQEAETKLPALKGLGSWHLIGHLQTNKPRKALELFGSVDSVDSLKLGEELARLAIQTGRVLPVMAEVSVAGEAQKFGFPLER